MTWLLAIRAEGPVRADVALALVMLRASAPAALLFRHLMLFALTLPSERTAELVGIATLLLLHHPHHRFRHLLSDPLQVVLVVCLRIDPLSLHCGIRRVVVLEDLFGGSDLVRRIRGSGFDAGVHASCTLS